VGGGCAVGFLGRFGRVGVWNEVGDREGYVVLVVVIHSRSYTRPSSRSIISCAETRAVVCSQ
jgi:hypothetical protein